MSYKRKYATNHLNEIIDTTGLSKRPHVKDEVEYLNENLTQRQLAAVARLLDIALLATHGCGHLPANQGWEAIRQEMELREAR